MVADWVQSFILDSSTLLAKKNHVYVGFSGGLDSSCLLYMLARLTQIHPECAVTAIHVNHGLSALADDWAIHCQKQAELYGVDCQVVNVTVESSGRGLEAAARIARWDAFLSNIPNKEHSILFLGHHANDQAETFFLRAMRASGWFAMSAMRKQSVYEGLLVCRPLLDISRSQLENMAEQYNLNVIEDDSNQSLDFDRNYIRHVVLPPLLARWPTMIANISQSLIYCQQDSDYLKQTVREKTKHLWVEKFGLTALSTQQFNLLSSIERSLILRVFIQDKGWYLPSKNQLATLLSQIESSHSASHAELKTQQYRIVLSRSYVYIFPASWFTLPVESLSAQLQSPDCIYYCPNPMRIQVEDEQSIPPDVLICFAHHPAFVALPRKQKKHLFQKNEIPSFLRAYAPFLWDGNGVSFISFSSLMSPV